MGLSREEFAAKARISLNTLIDAETNKRRPRDNTLRRIATTGGVTPGHFATGDTIDQPFFTPNTSVRDHVSPQWPYRFHWCQDAELAALLAARSLLDRLEQTDDPSIVFPTGITSSLLFDAMEDYVRRTKTPSLLRGKLFIDTETFGVSRTHPSSRHRYVLSRINRIAGELQQPIPTGNIKFFDGSFSTGAELLEYNAILRQFPASLHVIALSPDGELIGYEAGRYHNASKLARQPCSIIHLSNDAQQYIEPTQPSTAIIPTGMSHILNAKELIILVVHETKAGVLRRVMTEPVDAQYPASLLRLHKRTTIIATEAIGVLIGAELKRVLKSEADISLVLGTQANRRR